MGLITEIVTTPGIVFACAEAVIEARASREMARIMLRFMFSPLWKK